MFIHILALVLTSSVIPQCLAHRYQERNESKNKNYDVQIAETSKDTDEQFVQSTDMTKDETKFNFALTKKNV